MKATTNTGKNPKIKRKVRKIDEDISTVRFSLKTLSIIHCMSPLSQWELPIFR